MMTEFGPSYLIYGSAVRTDYSATSDIDVLVFDPSYDVPVRLERRTSDGTSVSLYIARPEVIKGDLENGSHGGYYAGKIALPVWCHNSDTSELVEKFRLLITRREAELPIVAAERYFLFGRYMEYKLRMFLAGYRGTH